MSTSATGEAPSSEVVTGLLPLKLIMECCASQDEMNDNVLKTIERGYEPFTPYVDSCSGEMSLVGAGPSIEYTLDELTGDVMAVNSAIGYLLDNGIVPKWGMIWDADPICENFAVPHPDITYLIGARCHPSVFERLKDCKVIVWHAGGDHNINDLLLEKQIMEPMINGGSAGVTRGMYVAVALGYRHLHIFGADSCYSNDGKTHIKGSLVPEKDFQCVVGNGEGALMFRTTPEWCSQVNEFRDIYTLFVHPALGYKITVHGDGMLPHMARLVKAKHEQGLLWLEDGTPHPSNVPTQMEPQNRPENEDKLIFAQPLEENTNGTNTSQ